MDGRILYLREIASKTWGQGQRGMPLLLALPGTTMVLPDGGAEEWQDGWKVDRIADELRATPSGGPTRRQLALACG